ncbi:SidA/IucD/PvdA family monooxygenase [Parendozoicomonas sp. Alg238-R29]|uniref:lysine N(6)-hydroxylase/L-ornithine N(5)-oxygenase family protein n=1 Tax=Parendozoicomonas sp. Alg238-R29 TaxID=2993446 RepID=UPI00248DF1D8|nr:SidA/IucD/PvdA family monooxygenase [Parendozoicomonas sp. Alg238-R29]
MTRFEGSLDLAGIGAGPFNLSLAALLDGIPTCNAAFFDNKEQFSWHPGLMLPGARMQTSCLKDLVTPVSPTSPWSFLNFLVSKGRFYDFMSLESFVISRQEFTEYMSWVAAGLQNLQFNSGIREVSFENGSFILRTNDQSYTANNLCLGTGKVPHLPECTLPFTGENCFHASSLNNQKPSLTGKRVAVIGGGQTGAEVFMNSLNGLWGAPSEVVWVSRRSNFEPLDESPFTNQFFTPAYVEAFHSIESSRKRTITDRQKLASDGITPSYLNLMYEELYYRSYVEEASMPPWNLLPDRTLCGMNKSGNGYQLEISNNFQQGSEHIEADCVILCTGFEYKLPEYLEPLLPSIDLSEGNLQLGSNFQVQWDSPANRNIYAVNAGLHSHGIAEPQLSLNAWRAAKIINNLLDYEHFALGHGRRLIEWEKQNKPSLSQNAA